MFFVILGHFFLPADLLILSGRWEVPREDSRSSSYQSISIFVSTGFLVVYFKDGLRGPFCVVWCLDCSWSAPQFRNLGFATILGQMLSDTA